MTTPFPLIERAVKELIEDKYPDAEDKVGGDLAYEEGDGFYVWLGLIPGGSTDEINGEWVLDIDVFSDSYGVAMTHALALEAVLVGRRHVTSTLLIDDCTQSANPTERPWDEESVYRIGGTYVFTARRSG